MNSRLLLGDCRQAIAEIEPLSVQTVVTSPPYFGLRDYGVDGQIGMEQTVQEYVAALTTVFRGVWDVLRDDGTVWLNLGDSYAQQGGRGKQGTTSARHGRRNVPAQEKPASTRPPDGLKPKDLIGIPWRVAFALQADGWYLRQDIIWHKRNAMPESVTDRCTKAHEYIFLLSKGPRYYYDADAIKEQAAYPEGAGNTAPYRVDRERPGENANLGGSRHKIGPRQTRNKRSVWEVTTQPFHGAHFAVFPPNLIRPCILAGAPEGGIVLDPFMGVGTTGVVSAEHGRRFIGCELNPEYMAIAKARIEEASMQGAFAFGS